MKLIHTIGCNPGATGFGAEMLSGSVAETAMAMAESCDFCVVRQLRMEVGAGTTINVKCRSTWAVHARRGDGLTASIALAR